MHGMSAGHAHALELFFPAVYKHRRIRDPCRPGRVIEAAIEAPLLHVPGDNWRFVMKWEVVIAGMALIVSIGVAIFSYVADRRGQHRQRFFEFSLFKMQSLELRGQHRQRFFEFSLFKMQSLEFAKKDKNRE